jgi:hypothetical protein
MTTKHFSGPPVSIEIELTTLMRDRMLEDAKRRNLSLKVFVRLLLEAAWAARCGPTGDAELDDAVSRALAMLTAGPKTKAVPAPMLPPEPPPPPPPIFLSAIGILIPPCLIAGPALSIEQPAVISLARSEGNIHHLHPVVRADGSEPKPLTDIQKKQIKAYRSVGKLPKEIAGLMGLNEALVRVFIYPHSGK